MHHQQLKKYVYTNIYYSQDPFIFNNIYLGSGYQVPTMLKHNIHIKVQ